MTNPAYEELKERLRRCRPLWAGNGPIQSPINPDGPEAAQAITTLLSDNARMREALQGALHEADWMIEEIEINQASKAAIRNRLHRHRATLNRSKGNG